MNSTATRRLIIAIGLWLACCGHPSSAHDIYSSWADARLLDDRLEITLTLARSCAHSLLPDAASRPAITPENFATIAPRLREAGPQLFELTVNGQPLPSRSTEVKISGDADVTFTLTHPRPVAGTLRFFAVFLGHLVAGHTVTLAVSDATGADLGWSPLTLDRARFQIRVPAVPAPKS